MPTIRKIRQTGTSKAISVPAGWLELQKCRFGTPLKKVLIEEHAGSLVIVPMPPTKELKK